MSAPASSQKRIVLIEDDDSVRRSLTLILRLRGYLVDAFRSGVEYLAQVVRTDADIFLIDYKMPKLDGLELLERLRADGIKAPAFLITGFHAPGLSDKATRVGFTAVLEKPISGQQIADHREDFT